MVSEGRKTVGNLPGLRRIHGHRTKQLRDLRLAAQPQVNKARATVAREQRRIRPEVGSEAGRLGRDTRLFKL